MEVKRYFMTLFDEEGSLAVEAVKEKLFSDHEDKEKDFEEKIEKYHKMVEAVIIPMNKQIHQKFERQFIKPIQN